MLITLKLSIWVDELSIFWSGTCIKPVSKISVDSVWSGLVVVTAQTQIFVVLIW